MELAHLVLVLCVAGPAAGLQYPLSYQYRYRASVAGVLPDEGGQQTLSSIDTTLEVDTVAHNAFVVKFNDTSVSDHHGRVECGGHRPTEPLQEMQHLIKEVFETPFRVTYDLNREPLLEVPPNDPLWMTNVRRAAVGLLLVVPTTEHLLKRSYTNTQTNTLDSDPHMSPLDPTTFSLKEDTIYGSCVVKYTLNPAPASARAQHPQPRRDIQRSAGKSPDGSWPKVSDHLYVLQRSPDLNRCDQRPLVFASSNTEGDNNHTASSDDRFFTQWSLGHLIVRGENDPKRSQNMRLEWAEVNAGALMKPFAVPGAEIHVVTNQTLQLEMIYKKRTPHQLAQLSQHRSLSYEMTTPWSQPSVRPPSWVRYGASNDPLVPVYPEMYLTGYLLNTSATQQLKEQILQEAKAVAGSLQGLLENTPPAGGPKAHQDAPGGASAVGKVGRRIAALTEGVKALTKEDLVRLDGLLLGDADDLARQVYHEAMAASGAPAAVAVVLDDLLHRGVSRLLGSLVTLASVASAAASPASARLLTSFVLTLADRTIPAGAEGTADRVWLHSALLMTVTAVRRLCAPDNRQFYGRQFDDSCNVETELLYLVRRLMKTTTTTTTDKVVYLRVLGYLRAEGALEELLEVVKSQEEDVRMRTAAVLSLLPSHTTGAARTKVFDSLGPLMTSQVEDPELRQAAAMVLLLWRPDQTWWLRLARASWHEESTVMSAFLTSAVQSVASLTGPTWRKQRQYAREARSLMRPMLSFSHQSFLSIIEAYTNPPVMETETQLGWLLNLETLLPRNLFMVLQGKLNSFKVPLFESELYGEHSDEVWGALRAAWYGPEISDPTGAKLLKEFNDILHGLGARISSRAPSGGLVLFRLFSGMHGAVAVPDAFLQLLNSGGDGGGVKLSRDVHFVKFLNPVWREVVVPSEVGIPVVGRVLTPAVLYQKGRYEVHYGTHHNQAEWKKDFKVSFHGNTTLNWGADSVLTALAPWQNTTLGAGVQVGGSVHLPSGWSGLELSRGPSHAKLELNLGCDADRKVAVFHGWATSYTLEEPMTPGSILSSRRLRHSPHATQHKTSTRLPSSLGLAGHVTSEGNDALPHGFPRSLWTLWLPHEDTPPRPHPHQSTLYWDTSGNFTKSFSFSLSYDAADGSQPGSTSADSRDFADFELTDTHQRRRRKLLMLTGTGGTLFTALANFSSSSHDILHEVLLASSSPRRSDAPQQEQRYHLTYLRSGVPQDVPRPQKVCLEVGLTTPLLPPLDRLDKLLQDPLKASFSGALVVGGSCKGSRQTEVGSLKAQLEVSPRQLLHLARHLPGQCEFDRLDPPSSLRRAAFYDALQLELSWRQDTPAAVLNTSYTLSRMLSSYSLPYTSSNCLHVDLPQRRVLVNLTRSHATRAASGWVSRPGCLDHVRDMPMPPLVDLLVPLHGRLTQDTQGRTSRALPAVVPPGDQCYVIPSRVVTFDGASYGVSGSSCARVLFTHTSPQRRVLVTAQGDEDSPQAPQNYRILLPKEALDIEIHEDTIKVNGEEISESSKEISGSSGNTAALIARSPDTVEVLLPRALHVFVRSSTALVLRILDTPRYRGAVQGMCGDFDGDVVGDLKGPRECLFTPEQGEVLGVAWTSGPCVPPDGLLEELKRQQWSCPRTPAELGLPAPSHYDPEACRLEAHQLVTRPDQVCLTTVPVGGCRPGCGPLSGGQREAMFEVKCWPEERLPESLQRAQKEGHLPYLEEAAGELLPALLSYPTECIPIRRNDPQ